MRWLSSCGSYLTHSRSRGCFVASVSSFLVAKQVQPRQFDPPRFSYQTILSPLLETFDIFETVLVRSLTPPMAVFGGVGARARCAGLVSCSSQAFSYARQSAEERALHTHGDRVTLDRIYDELAFALALTPTQRGALVRIEMETEADLLRPVPAVRPLVEAARATYGRVVFVSDMYLPHGFIQEQLQRHGFWSAGDVLYVSHAHGCLKGSGALFNVVAAAEHVPADRIRHYGNHPRADVEGARRAGATGELLDAGNPTRYEERLQSHHAVTDGIAAALAGAARMARLAEPRTGREKALVEVAAGVAGPLLTAFVLWVLEQARRRGLERLYFVAREGQILFDLAQRLAPRLGISVDLRYLYASRIVLNRATLGFDVDLKAWSRFVWKAADCLSNKQVLLRTGISEAVASRVIADSGASAERWADATDRRPVEEALAQMAADGTLAATVARHHSQVRRYLEAEGLFDAVPHAVVDVGWQGTQHDALIEFQHAEGVSPAFGLFWGIMDHPSSWQALREAYFYDERSQSGVPLHGEQLLIELFCAADHGTLVGFEETGGCMRPVVAEGRTHAVASWGLPLVQRTIAAVADHLELDAVAYTPEVDLRPALAETMNLFWSSPSRLEAEAWGTFPWELGQSHELLTVDFAPAARLPAVVASMARRLADQPSRVLQPRALLEPPPTCWVAGTAARSGAVAGALQRPGLMAHRWKQRARQHPLLGAAKVVVRPVVQWARKVQS